MTNRMTPMTNDQLRAIAPSVFATEPWHQMSDAYRFVPTIEVVDAMRSEGFQPVAAVQSRTRVPGKAPFTRHQLRFRDFRNGNVPATRTLGELYLELVLTNSHDGASKYGLDAGLLRLACLNGMVVSDRTLQSMRVPHKGNIGDVISITHEIVEQFPRVMDRVEGFQRLRLAPPEQHAFAQAALAVRYDEGETPISADMALMTRRASDAEPTLWNTLNRLQENLTQGGLRYRTEAQPRTAEHAYVPSRRMRTRPVEGISENTRLNKALWTLAEEMERIKG